MFRCECAHVGDCQHTRTRMQIPTRVSPNAGEHRQFGEKVIRRRIMRVSVGHYSPRDVRSRSGSFRGMGGGALGGDGWGGVITRTLLSMSDASDASVRLGEITGFARNTRADVSKLGSEVVAHAHIQIYLCICVMSVRVQRQNIRVKG